MHSPFPRVLHFCFLVILISAQILAHQLFERAQVRVFENNKEPIVNGDKVITSTLYPLREAIEQNVHVLDNFTRVTALIVR